MKRNPPAAPPMTTDVVLWKAYIRYLMVEVELRDLKHSRLVDHIDSHC